MKKKKRKYNEDNYHQLVLDKDKKKEIMLLRLDKYILLHISEFKDFDISDKNALTP